MTEEEWLACEDHKPMVKVLHGGASDRKLRLLACACCWRIWPLITDPVSRTAVEVKLRMRSSRYGVKEMTANPATSRTIPATITRNARSGFGDRPKNIATGAAWSQTAPTRAVKNPPKTATIWDQHHNCPRKPRHRSSACSGVLLLPAGVRGACRSSPGSVADSSIGGGGLIGPGSSASCSKAGDGPATAWGVADSGEASGSRLTATRPAALAAIIRKNSTFHAGGKWANRRGRSTP
jgi:hypothetical protein